MGVISAKEAEDLLFSWANLPGPRGYFPNNTPETREWREAAERLTSRSPLVFDFVVRKRNRLDQLLKEGQRWLTMAWDATDSRHRDWYLFVWRYQYQSRRVTAEFGDSLPGGIGPDAERFFSHLIPDVPDVTPFEAAIFYLQVNLSHRMLHCPNPTCAKPYFFKTKKVQKYCSPACAEPARREAKRIWWEQNRGKGAR